MQTQITTRASQVSHTPPRASLEREISPIQRAVTYPSLQTANDKIEKIFDEFLSHFKSTSLEEKERIIQTLFQQIPLQGKELTPHEKSCICLLEPLLNNLPKEERGFFKKITDEAFLFFKETKNSKDVRTKLIYYMLLGHGLSVTAIGLIRSFTQPSEGIPRTSSFAGFFLTGILDAFGITDKKVSVAAYGITLGIHNLPPLATPAILAPVSQNMDNNLFKLMGLGLAVGVPTYALSEFIGFVGTVLKEKNPREYLKEIMQEKYLTARNRLLNRSENNTPEKDTPEEALGKEVRQKAFDALLLAEESTSTSLSNTQTQKWLDLCRRNNNLMNSKKDVFKKMGLFATSLLGQSGLLVWAEKEAPDIKVNKAAIALGIMISILAYSFHDRKRATSFENMASNQLVNFCISGLLQAVGRFVNDNPSEIKNCFTGLGIALLSSVLVLKSNQITDGIINTPRTINGLLSKSKKTSSSEAQQYYKQIQELRKEATSQTPV